MTSVDSSATMYDDLGWNVSKSKWTEESPYTLSINLDITCDSAYIPEKIIYNGTTTVCIFRDGVRITARPTKDDDFDKEVGVAMCIMKRVFGSRSEFQRHVEKAYDQNEKRQKGE